jgi:hypothetical protein
VSEWLRKLPDLADALLVVGVLCIVAAIAWRVGAVYALGAFGAFTLLGGVLLGRAS